MRTTLELDDDIAAAARQLAQQRGMTIGQVISDLVRQSIESQSQAPVRNGIILFAPKPGAPKPTLSLVNDLRD